jgi:long-chain acyl-CoA synthetase
MQVAPWLGHYDEGVPASVAPYPERTLLDDLGDAVALRPGAPAVLFKGRTVTWGELEERSDAFAAALAGLGVAPGSPCCCPTARSSSSASWAPGRRGRSWSP